MSLSYPYPVRVLILSLSLLRQIQKLRLHKCSNIFWFFLYSVYFDLFLVPNVLMGDNGVTELFTVETPQFFGAIFEVNEPKFAKTIKSAP